MSNREPAWRSWVRKAESDRLNIANNMAAGRVPWDTVCFHAQQAAEKYLKGYLVWRDETPLRTHDLVALLAACADADPSLASLEEDCRALTYHAVGSRYPEETFSPGEGDARRMVAASDRVCEAIGRRLPQGLFGDASG